MTVDQWIGAGLLVSVCVSEVWTRVKADAGPPASAFTSPRESADGGLHPLGGPPLSHTETR